MGEIFYLVFAILLAIALAAFFWLNRRLNFKAGPTHHTETDLANMMILFQTMRDVLTEQKELARQFNASLDDKVTMVRKLVDSARDERKTIRDTQNGIADIVKQTKEDIATLQEKVASLREAIDSPPPSEAPETPETPPIAVAEEMPEQKVDEEPVEAPTARSPASEAPTTEMPADVPAALPEGGEPAWTGVDFRDDQPDVRPEPVEQSPSLVSIQSAGPEGFGPSGSTPASTDEPKVPQTPSNEEPVAMPMRHAFELPKAVPDSSDDLAASRNAFRQLLSLEPAAQPVKADPLDRLGGQSKPGNGRHGNLTPVQRRVYEYSDAGMRVPEIARELGVGKGEVRLILSLRKDKPR